MSAYIRPRGIVVHLSASPWGDAAVIDQWHRVNGWNGIGYHGVVLNGRRTSKDAYDVVLDGKIEPGRELGPKLAAMGAHCHAEGMNGYTIGVCCIGTPNIVPYGARVLKAGRFGRVLRLPYMTERQLQALLHWCRVQCKRYGLDPMGTFMHPRTGAPVRVISQHSEHDRGKPYCASLNTAVLRKLVAEGMR